MRVRPKPKYVWSNVVWSAQKPYDETGRRFVTILRLDCGHSVQRRACTQSKYPSRWVRCKECAARHQLPTDRFGRGLAT